METILSVRNLHKSFDNLVVLDDVSLELKKGEVVVILGPSGCGKSTFLRCLNGLENIQDGQIYAQGKFGMVFQNYDLFPHKTILQNIILAPVVVQKRKKNEVIIEAEKLLDRIGLGAKKNNFPRQLSGGQKQRVAIVRALIMHPEILLLDEITAALDPEMVKEVLDLVLSLANEGRTMLIVTHEMSFAKAVADKVIFMDGGKIVEEGTSKEVFDTPKSERLKRFLRTFSYEESIE